MISNKINIYIFARRPEISIGKSRLKNKIGKILGSNFYHNNLSNLLRKLNSDKRINITLCVNPDSSTKNWPRHISPKIKRIPQGKGDIGIKMSKILNMNKEKKILIGSDIPKISTKVIMETWKKLNHCNVILGPAYDGGFWLIGFAKRTNIQNLFKNIDWDKNNTLKQVKNNIPKHKKLLFTQILHDID